MRKAILCVNSSQSLDEQLGALVRHCAKNDWRVTQVLDLSSQNTIQEPANGKTPDEGIVYCYLSLSTLAKPEYISDIRALIKDGSGVYFHREEIDSTSPVSRNNPTTRWLLGL